MGGRFITIVHIIHYHTLTLVVAANLICALLGGAYIYVGTRCKFMAAASKKPQYVAPLSGFSTGCPVAAFTIYHEVEQPHCATFRIN